MKLATERPNPKSQDIDKLSTVDMITLINDEDAKVAQAVRRVIPQIAQATNMIASALENGGRLFYVGAGTSGRLGLLDALECVPTFGTQPDLVQALIAGGSEAMLRSVEGAEDDSDQAAIDLAVRDLRQSDIVCGLAASGRTPYVIGALRYASSVGANCIAIACNAGAPILELADVGIAVEVGPEVIAGSTRMKAGSAQKMILNMLSTGAMIKLGKVYGNLMVDVKVTNQKLAKRALDLVAQLTSKDEERAKALLDAAGNQVKTAVVMGKLKVTSVEASKLLQGANGHLRRVIDEVD